MPGAVPELNGDDISRLSIICVACINLFITLSLAAVSGSWQLGVPCVVVRCMKSRGMPSGAYVPEFFMDMRGLSGSFTKRRSGDISAWRSFRWRPYSPPSAIGGCARAAALASMNINIVSHHFVRVLRFHARQRAGNIFTHENIDQLIIFAGEPENGLL